ncbi:MAG TPA: DUF559 domain-containing protein [Actinomycetota bacterium]|nr:DUF559 domain-containing protein [Actinomycetota bacterium]
MSSDRRLNRLLARQSGLIARHQAISGGFTPRMISARLQSGGWNRVHPGVYQVGNLGLSHEQELVAAMLWAGEGSALSHRSAAELLGLPGGDKRSIDLTSPRRLRSSTSRINFHRVPHLPTADLIIEGALTFTSATRTLLDLCEIISLLLLEDALDEAIRRKLTSLPALKLRMQAPDVSGRPGISQLRSLVSADDVCESPLERMLVRLLRTSSLPPPERQFELKKRGRRVRLDFAYVEANVAIECDGYRWHSMKSAWESDIERRNFINALGWRVIQVTWSSLRERPAEILAEIETAVNGTAGTKKYRRAT